MAIKNRKIIIILCLIVLLVVGGSSVIAIEKNKKEEQKIYNEKIENYINEINEKYNELTLEKDESKKLEKLKNIITDQDGYKSGKEKDKKVLKAYEYSINELKKEFKENNEKTLKESTSLDLEKENKDSLVKKSEALKALKGKVKTQETIIYSKKEKEEVDKKIESLLKQYEDKTTQLDKEAKEKQEAEEKAKEEQAAKTAEEAQVQEQPSQLEAQGGADYSENDTSGNNNGNSSTNSNSSSSNNNSGNTQSSSSDNNGQNNTVNSNSSNSVTAPSTKAPTQSTQKPSAPAASTPKASTPSNSSGKDYGWSEFDGGSKQDNWVDKNADGSYSAGTGNGTNDKDLGGGWTVD